MKILVTGSAGHLGEALMIMLRSKGIDAVGFDIKKSSYTSLVGSIVDKSFVEKSMKGITSVIHTATLHKPHIATHTNQDFIDTNITGTYNLLDQAARFNVESFIFTSTTSAFGDILVPAEGSPAIWVTEETKSIPKNIYGVTKSAAEDLCRLFYRNHNLPCLILKTSRFFPEEDDNKTNRDAYTNDNLKANEFLYRRVDVEDAAAAHLCALEHVKNIGFDKYIISASSPFGKNDLSELRKDAASVVAKYYPDFIELYQKQNWTMHKSIDRVYSNNKALEELGWEPKFDFGKILDAIRMNKKYGSELARQLGKKGYHSDVFEDGPYPVIDQ